MDQGMLAINCVCPSGMKDQIDRTYSFMHAMSNGKTSLGDPRLGSDTSAHMVSQAVPTVSTTYVSGDQKEFSSGRFEIVD
jgi:hypothetical protein